MSSLQFRNSVCRGRKRLGERRGVRERGSGAHATLYMLTSNILNLVKRSKVNAYSSQQFWHKRRPTSHYLHMHVGYNGTILPG